MLHSYVIHRSMAAPGNWHHGRVHIFPLAFTIAMEEIIRASKWVVGGERQQGEIHLPPIRACLNNKTTITTISACYKKKTLAKLKAELKMGLNWSHANEDYMHCHRGNCRNKLEHSKSSRAVNWNNSEEGGQQTGETVVLWEKQQIKTEYEHRLMGYRKDAATPERRFRFCLKALSYREWQSICTPTWIHGVSPCFSCE